MALFRYKGSRVWTMDFFFHGMRIRESTGTHAKTLALEIQRKRRRELEEGNAGIQRRNGPRLLSFAAQEWLELKKATLAPKTVVIERTNLGHLLPRLGRLLVCDIEAQDVAKYQQERVAEGAAAKTVNLEMGTLRAILRCNGQWARLQQSVKMLPVRDDVGRALLPHEESALLAACGKSRSRGLPIFVILAIETGARYGVLRTLQWCRVDLDSRYVKWVTTKPPQAPAGSYLSVQRRLSR